jgi:hypothetical protein
VAHIIGKHRFQQGCIANFLLLLLILGGLLLEPREGHTPSVKPVIMQEAPPIVSEPCHLEEE